MDKPPHTDKDDLSETISHSGTIGEGSPALGEAFHMG